MKKITLMMLSLTIALLGLAAAAKADPVVYDNGPINGTINAYPINGGSSVTDSFVLSTGTTVSDAEHVGMWTCLYVCAMPTTVDWSITSGPFSGTTIASGTAVLTATPFSTNGYFQIWDVSFIFPGVSLAAGTYWFQLQNATADIYTVVYWDQNNGPSSAKGAFHPDVTGSESFQLTGTAGGGTTPEPGSLTLLGSGLIGVAQILRRKLRKA
jgi:hypothetical protein